MLKIRKFITIIIVLSFCLFFAGFVSASGKSWNFEKWQVDIQINKDSTFVVRETQTFNFRGNFHWVKRDIAKQKLRKISDLKVFDELDRELKGNEIEITEYSNQVSIKLNFDLTDVTKTWTFQYKIRGGLGYFEDHDELYWNAVSSEREVPIKEVEVFVHLPQPISSNDFQQKIYIGLTGAQNTSNNYQVIDSNTLKYWGYNIGAFENFTIVAGWPKGIIEQAGLVKIESLPKAKILIDGEKTGLETPAILEEDCEISSGEHTISVRKFGWQAKGKQSKKILVQSGKTEEIKFELEKTWWFILLIIGPFIIPLVFIFFVLRKQIRSPRVKKTIIAQYEPPDDLFPAEVGGLVDFKIQPRDITAIIIDLAYRGYIKIIEREEKMLFWKKLKYSLVNTKAFNNDNALRDYEKTLLLTLFNVKSVIEIDDLKKQGHQLIFIFKAIKKNIFKNLVDNRYFSRNPMGKSLILFQVLGTIVLFLSIPIQVILSPICLGFALFITGLISLVSARILFVFLTPKGAEAKWYALGFREYLQVAEKFRLDACTPETFEKYLSYAIVFRIEKKWANRFIDIYKKPPSWFESSRPILAFNIITFTSSISAISNIVSSNIASTSPSGGISGFGGGGFSGGGGGGGGSSAG